MLVSLAADVICHQLHLILRKALETEFSYEKKILALYILRIATSIP